MSSWQIGLIVVAVILTPIILYRLHRLLLRWEERGWIYYRRKKPQSGAMSCFSAIQQAIEPGYEHVAKIRQERREEASERELLLAKLLSQLQAEQIDREAIRELLTGCADGDWQNLYAEAVRLASNADTARAARMPAWDEVRPND
jgi:hypothetical protein